MSWQFQISTGQLSLDGALVDEGYSGDQQDYNNPADVGLKNQGPLPPGTYTIGAPRVPVDHLGPLAMPLYPSISNNMMGRGAFFIHGDDAAMDHTASDGCIILQRVTRQQIADSTDRTLEVVP